jgi:hypothetical protein
VGTVNSTQYEICKTPTHLAASHVAIRHLVCLGEIMLIMATWEDFKSPGWAVWCDKTAVLGALMALRGELFTGPALVDAVSLVDGLVWFDHVVVDATLDAEWPEQVADAVALRPLQPAERSQLREAVVRTWNEGGVGENCKQFWRRYFDEPGFDFTLSDADYSAASGGKDSAPYW